MKKLMTAVATACLATVAFAQSQPVPSANEIRQKAEAGDDMAQAQYAQMLQMGQGVEKNEAEALKWYLKSAEAGNAYAQANMGVFCQTGGCGVQRDLAKAAEWYGKAAAQGNAYAQFYLSSLYESGNGVEKDASKALVLLAKAAKGGMPDAQVKYALCLAQGAGVERNLEAAIKWAENAAAVGNPAAPKMVATVKALKEMDDKTPKSFLGIEFGAKLDSYKKRSGIIDVTRDGSAISTSVPPAKPFRRFSDKNEMEVYGSRTTHKVFKFKWCSETFSGELDRQEQEIKEEAQKICAVIGKKFGIDFEEASEKYLGTIGWLKIEINADGWGGVMWLTVTNTYYEDLAKKEVEAIMAAQGDGSDAL